MAAGYGYGYAVGTPYERPARFHFGDNPGFHTFLARIPDHGVTVAILSNTEETDIEGVLRRLEPVATAG